MDWILSTLESIGALIFVFFFIGLCIFSHELGHFLAGRWRKMHIDAFSIGFKKIWAKKINGVEYRIGCIPLGGYVELPQVDATDEVPKAADGTELKRANPIDRIITAVAGPLFNIVFGLLLGCVVWWGGIPQDSPTMTSIKVAAIEEKSPEYNAGLRPGDVIVKVNGQKFSDTWVGFVQKLMFSVGEVTLDIKRDGKEMQIVYTPTENPNAPGRLKHEKIGYPFFIPVLPIELQPLKGDVAEKAGILRGDILLSIDGNPISSLSDFQMMLNRAENRDLDFELERKGKIVHVKVRPELIPGIKPEDVPLMVGISMDLAEATAGKIKVVETYKGAPADLAGIRRGDIIQAIQGQTLNKPHELNVAINAAAGKPIVLDIVRDGKQEKVTLTPVRYLPRTIGVELMLTAHPTPFAQFRATLDSSYKSLRGMLVGGANFLGLTKETSTLKPRHMSGPLGMGTLLYSSVKNVSLMTGLYFVVMISFALAIFNLLPLPVLDGGHILFAIIEMIIRRPIPTAVVKTLSVTFITLLISLMLYITYFDILRTYRNFAEEKGSSTETVASKVQKQVKELKHEKNAPQP